MKRPQVRSVREQSPAWTEFNPESGLLIAVTITGMHAMGLKLSENLTELHVYKHVRLRNTQTEMYAGRAELRAAPW